MLVETKKWKNKYADQETIFFILNPFPPLIDDGNPVKRHEWAQTELSDWIVKFFNFEDIVCLKYPEWGPLDLILVYVQMKSQEDIEMYEGVHLWNNLLNKEEQWNQFQEEFDPLKIPHLYSLQVYFI